jgi:hypothetical protein
VTTVRTATDREKVDLPIQPEHKVISDGTFEIEKKNMVLTAKPRAGSTHRAAG